MKDYTINEEEKDNFILNYKIIDGQIVINLASGKTEKIYYNKENEQKILKLMEDQVYKCNEFNLANELKTQEHEKKYKLYKNSNIVYVISCATFLCSLAFGPVAAASVLGATSLYYGYSIYKFDEIEKEGLENRNSLFKDLRKQKKFLNNKVKMTKVMNSEGLDLNLDINKVGELDEKVLDNIINEIDEIYLMEDVKPKVKKL